MSICMNNSIEYDTGEIVRIEVKVKLSLCSNWAPRHEGVLTSALAEGGEEKNSQPLPEVEP